MEYYQRSMVYDGRQWFAAGGRKNISRIRWNSKLFCSFLKAKKNEKTLPRINSLSRFMAILYRLMGCFRDSLSFRNVADAPLAQTGILGLVEWLRHGTYGIALGLFLPIACRLFIVLQFYDQILFFESLISSSSGEEAVLLRFEGGALQWAVLGWALLLILIAS